MGLIRARVKKEGRFYNDMIKKEMIPALLLLGYFQEIRVKDMSLEEIEIFTSKGLIAEIDGDAQEIVFLPAPTTDRQ